MRSLILTALVLALVLLPGAAHGQTERGFSLAPRVGPTWFGHRYELELPPNQDLGLEAELGPTTGLELGLAAEIHPWDRFGIVFTGSWTGMDYARKTISDDDREQRNVAGEQSVVRVTAGVRYRIVPQAPGFFSAGVVVNRFMPESVAHAEGEEDRTELGGFGGLGLDFGGGSRYVRAEGRIMFMAPGADPLVPVGSAVPEGSYEPRSLAVDYVVTLAFVFQI